MIFAFTQANLRLCWSHIKHCWKSHVAAHLCLLSCGCQFVMPLPEAVVDSSAVCNCYISCSYSLTVYSLHYININGSI